jgi:hypothetical protein
VRSKRLFHILIGITLVSIGVYFTLRTGHGLSALWRRESAIKPTQEKRRITDPEDVTGAAQLKVYGVLAPHDETISGDADEANTRRPAGPLSTLDRVYGSVPAGPHRLLRRRLSLKSYLGFSFTVPAHALHPKVEGTFKSVGRSSEPDVTNVDVMLLNPEEFEDLLSHHGGYASFSTTGHAGQVDWALSPTILAPQKYYLVFHNPLEQSVAELLDVDFTISFQ